MKTLRVQGSAKRWALGCVKSPTAARGSQEAGFTQPRVRLIAHLSLSVQVVETMSRRISLATRWMIHQRPDSSSEQYHVINYGIGGQIEVHLDNWGPDSTHYHPGGTR